MSSVKKYNGNLIIQTPYKANVTSNITLDTDTVFITGNLYVRGNTSEISSNVTTITDNFITLNDGETGNGVSVLGYTSGLTIDRGTAPGGNVKLQWNEYSKQWQISGVFPGAPGDSTQFLPITVSSTGYSAVFDDKAPVLAANLNVNGFTIYANVSSTSYVTVQGALQLKQANVVPNFATGSSVFYGAVSGNGQTGLYVVNDQVSNEELITKRRALGLSILL